MKAAAVYGHGTPQVVWIAEVESRRRGIKSCWSSAVYPPPEARPPAGIGCIYPCAADLEGPTSPSLVLIIALGRKLSAGALLLVQRATVLGWHRALVNRHWAAFGLRGPGRPKVPAECRELVLKLAWGNPLWGYQRIRGELLQLGHRVCSTSIRNLLRRHRIPPAPRRSGLTLRRFL